MHRRQAITDFRRQPLQHVDQNGGIDATGETGGQSLAPQIQSRQGRAGGGEDLSAPRFP